MKLKQLLKNSTFIRSTVKKVRIYKAFYKDAVFFAHNYVEGKDTKERLEYRLLFLIHNIEKGMSRKDKRPFGVEKIGLIINYLEKFKSNGYDLDASAYHMGKSILVQWLQLWKKMNWEIKPDMMAAVAYIEAIEEVEKSGIQTINSYEVDQQKEYSAVINGRHSIREFSSISLDEKDIMEAMALVSKSPSACNRQMCKAYHIKLKEHTEYLFSTLQGIPGFDRETTSFFIVTYDTNALFSSGERNQGYFNAGLFAMSIVNAFQYKGIGSCILQWGNNMTEENLAKNRLGIPQNERIATVIAAGYYPKETTIPMSTRKKVTEIYRLIE